MKKREEEKKDKYVMETRVTGEQTSFTVSLTLAPLEHEKTFYS